MHRTLCVQFTFEYTLQSVSILFATWYSYTNALSVITTNQVYMYEIEDCFERYITSYTFDASCIASDRIWEWGCVPP